PSLGDAGLGAPGRIAEERPRRGDADGAVALVAVAEPEVVAAAPRRCAQVRGPADPLVVVAVVAPEQERRQRVLLVAQPPRLDRHDLGVQRGAEAERTTAAEELLEAEHVAEVRRIDVD